MKQTLQNLLAEGKTSQVLDELRTLTASDVELHHQVIVLAARFAENERQKHGGTLENAPLSIEHNKINVAVLAVLEKLPNDIITSFSNNNQNIGHDKGLKNTLTHLSFQQIAIQRSKEELLSFRLRRNIRIDKTLLITPSTDHDLLVQADDQDDVIPLRQCLEAVWKNELGTGLILQGEGGSGKTYSLYQLWETLLHEAETGGPFPIYLELNNFEDTKNYVLLTIANKLSNGKEGETKAWLSALPRREQKPAIVLLLDGHNEVAENLHKALHLRLEEFLQGRPYIQVIVSSRYNVKIPTGAGRFANLRTVRLKTLDPLQIAAYLQKNGVEKPDESMLPTLANPFDLVMYVEIHAKQQGNGRLEILKQWAQYQQYNTVPVQKYYQCPVEETARAGLLITNFIYHKIAAYQNRYPDQLNYSAWPRYLDAVFRICSYIGYQMADKNAYTIGRKDLLNWKTQRHYQEGLDDLLHILSDQLVLLTTLDAQMSYNFQHQNFRDYFAAQHILNELEDYVEAVNTQLRSKKDIPPCINDHALPPQLRKLIGEIAGEYQNVPQWDGSRWLKALKPTPLTQCLELLRHQTVNHAVWNIITIWIETRNKDLSLCNFFKLDLKNLNFYDITLSHSNTNGSYIACNFRRAKINPEQFFHQGNTSPIYDISIVYEKDYPDLYSGGTNILREKTRRLICSKSKDGIFLWDKISGVLIAKYSHPQLRFKEREIWRTSKEEDFYYDIDNTLKIGEQDWHLMTILDSDLIADYKNICNFDPPALVNKVRYGGVALHLYKTTKLSYRFVPLNYQGWHVISPNNQYVVTSNDESNDIEIYDLTQPEKLIPVIDEKGEIVDWVESKMENYIEKTTCISRFRRDEKKHQLRMLNGREFNFSYLDRIKPLASARCCAYHPSEDRIIVVETNGKITEWHWKKSTSKPTSTFNFSGLEYVIHGYNPNGDSLMVSKGNGLYEYSLNECKFIHKFIADSEDAFTTVAFDDFQEVSGNIKKSILAATNTGKIYNWDYDTKEVLYILNANASKKFKVDQADKFEVLPKKNSWLYELPEFKQIQFDAGIKIAGCNLSSKLLIFGKDFSDWMTLKKHGAMIKLYLPITFCIYHSDFPDARNFIINHLEQQELNTNSAKTKMFLLKLILITITLFGKALQVILILIIVLPAIPFLKMFNLKNTDAKINISSLAKKIFIPSKLVKKYT